MLDHNKPYLLEVFQKRFALDVLEFQIGHCCEYFGIKGQVTVLATFLIVGQIFFQQSGHPVYLAAAPVTKKKV